MVDGKDKKVSGAIQWGGGENHCLRFTLLPKKTLPAGRYPCSKSLQTAGAGSPKGQCPESGTYPGGIGSLGVGLPISFELNRSWKKDLQGNKSLMQRMRIA